jgi:hypothetical protein
MKHEPQRIAFEDFAAHLPQVFDQVKRQNQPVLVEREGDTYLVEKQQPEGPARRRHKTTGADDPLWHIVRLADGLDLPAGPGDVSQHVDAYLAEAYLPKR